MRGHSCCIVRSVGILCFGHARLDRFGAPQNFGSLPAVVRLQFANSISIRSWTGFPAVLLVVCAKFSGLRGIGDSHRLRSTRAGSFAKRKRPFLRCSAFLVTGPVGILFYNLFPACGPRYLFQQGFPFHVFPIHQASRLLLEPTAIEGARNAMPSLHMAWTLLAFWYSRGLSWWERSIALFFVAFTVLGTMGLGEHWFADLVVAFPFALMIQASCAYNVPWKEPARISAFFLGLLGTLGWFASSRYAPKFFWSSPIVPWGLVIATIALTILRQVKLDRAAALEPLPKASDLQTSHVVAAVRG